MSTPGRSFALSSIGQIGIAVSDIGRAVAFYRDVLGLPLLFQAPNMAFFDCGGVRLMLGPSTGQGNPASSNPVLYYRVVEIRSATETLRSRGITFERDPHLVARMPEYDLWMALFRDPDGNLLAVMCERPRHGA